MGLGHVLVFVPFDGKKKNRALYVSYDGIELE